MVVILEKRDRIANMIAHVYVSIPVVSSTKVYSSNKTYVPYNEREPVRRLFEFYIKQNVITLRRTNAPDTLKSGIVQSALPHPGRFFREARR